MTPESIEKSRLEFEKIIYTERHHLTKDMEFDEEEKTYYNPVLSSMFDGFLLRQESLVVELPYAQIYFGASYFGEIELKDRLQSAGINYTERE